MEGNRCVVDGGAEHVGCDHSNRLVVFGNGLRARDMLETFMLKAK
jgi:hypothetical protein